MPNVSDIIEDFLLSILGEDEKLNISRNELANYFACAPSQINYVLSTRFTPEKGYTIESRRGGGGFITVIRLSSNPSGLQDEIFSKTLAEGISYAKAEGFIDRTLKEGLMTGREAALLKAAVTDKALITPTPYGKDALRLSILRAAYLELMKSREEE